MPRNAVEVEQPNPPSEQEAYAELESILRSDSFQRSERLQRFLRFICEMTLKGEGARINEYLIGSEVFQRGDRYSPSEDSIVRRQALTLRQKLQEYYADESKEHTVRIELPVGRYVPVFRRLDPPKPAAVDDLSVSEGYQALENGRRPSVGSWKSDPRESAWNGKWKAAAAIVVFAAGLGAGAVLFRRAPQEALPIGPAVREIWSAWLAPKSTATVCFSSPLTAVVKHFETQLPPETLPKRFLAKGEVDREFRRAFRLGENGFIYYTPAVNQTKTGEAIAGVHVSSLLATAGVTVRSGQARFLNWDEIRTDNYVLLGHNEANRWLEPLLNEYPFRLVATTDARQRGILNTKPGPSEPTEYRISYSHERNDRDTEYALISVLPGIASNRQLILINGLNAQATQAAAEFLTSEASAAELLGRLKRAAPGHRGVWHFQAVLRTEVFDKVPSRVEIVTVRVL
jgi:hypothetical protein